MTRPSPRVVSIPPGAPYLPTLVDALVNGKLIEGFAPKDDPLALSSVTIWVPTRRAVRVLSDEFAARTAADGTGHSALLPTILALGDADEDDFGFHPASGGEPELQPVISAVERQLILSRLVARWAQTLRPEQRDLYQGADIIMPSSQSDAVWFAADLARLMDTVATEEADWSKLENLVDADHANWWQLTREFLQIATSMWPQLLAERGVQDASTARAHGLRRQAMNYRERGSSGPVIAAGSTGSIPATADLLQSIAMLDQGVVVLPGLDRDLDEMTWSKIDLPDNDRDDSGTAPGHPQYGLKKLLAHLGIDRDHTVISHIGGVENTSTGWARVREKLLAEALRPSQSTGEWQGLNKRLSPQQKANALEGVALVEAKGERDEALAIALALRETLATDDATAALITPDRNLARRVSIEMIRFGVKVDDSAGQPLSNRPAGVFLKLLLQIRFAPLDPVALISLLKHPLARFGFDAEQMKRRAMLFELALLRGAISPPVAGESHAEVTEARLKAAQEKRTPRSVKRFSAEDWDGLTELSLALDEIFGAGTMSADLPVGLEQIVIDTISCLEKSAVDNEGALNHLYTDEDGKALQAFLEELIECNSVSEVVPSQWPGIVDALTAARVVRPVGGTHPRVAILGPLEARLQTFDRVVLGGLNEKSWPGSTRNDPFLSRPMKTALGLPPPERRTGLAAHDFQMLLGMKDVVLTRSKKSDNAPTIASRWIQRLMIVGGEQATDAMRQRGKKYLDWAAAIDLPAVPSKSCGQPRPIPPVDIRPVGLSITEVQTWIEDPYVIYARHILKLEALKPLLRDADAREKGTLYHGILEDFVRCKIDPNAETALEELLELARHHFDTTNVPLEHAAQWWPRFETIAASFIDWQRLRVAEARNIFVELGGRTADGLDGFTLSGRADRIDQLADGGLALFDYKTSGTPAVSKVRSLDAPQLPLTAAMAARGAFQDIEAEEAAMLAYVRLLPGERFKFDTVEPTKTETLTPSQLAEEAWQRLRLLISAYRDPQKDYRSKARIISEQDYESDYDHLARVREWSVSEDGEDAS